MAKNETKPLSADVLKADAAALAAIEEMGDYSPPNADYSQAKLDASATVLKKAAEAFAKAEAAWQTARDGNVAAQWGFHNAILGAKQQIVAQYGDDSDEAQAVGLTKKSERSKPSRRPQPQAK